MRIHRLLYHANLLHFDVMVSMVLFSSAIVLEGD